MEWTEGPKPKESGVYLVRTISGFANSEVTYKTANFTGISWGGHCGWAGETVTHYAVIEEPVPLGRHQVHADHMGRLKCVVGSQKLNHDFSTPLAVKPAKE